MKTKASRKDNKITVISKIQTVPEDDSLLDYDSEVENDGQWCLVLSMSIDVLVSMSIDVLVSMSIDVWYSLCLLMC